MLAEELALDDDELAGREIRQDLRVFNLHPPADLIFRSVGHVVDGPPAVRMEFELAAEPFLLWADAEAGIRAISARGLIADRRRAEPGGAGRFGGGWGARLAPLGAKAVGAQIATRCASGVPY